MIDVLPIGSKLRIQVIAKGFQTYGADFDNDKSEIDLGIRLKRPGEQYSIYKSHDDPKEKPVPMSKESGSADTDKDKRADSEPQAGAQPSASQPQPQ